MTVIADTPVGAAAVSQHDSIPHEGENRNDEPRVAEDVAAAVICASAAEPAVQYS